MLPDYFGRMHGGEVKGHSHYMLAWLYYQDPAAFASYMQAIASRGLPIYFWPWYQPGTPTLDVALFTQSIKAAKPFWGQVRRLGLDEPSVGKVKLEGLIKHANQIIAGEGLTLKPWDVNHTVPVGLNGDDIFAQGVARHGFELYMHPSTQNSPTLLSDLDAQTTAQVARLNGRPGFFIKQGYIQIKGTGPLDKWTNIPALKDINEYGLTAMEKWPNFEDLISFAYDYDDPPTGPRGTRTIGPDILNIDKKIYAAFEAGI